MPRNLVLHALELHALDPALPMQRDACGIQRLGVMEAVAFLIEEGLIEVSRTPRGSVRRPLSAAGRQVLESMRRAARDACWRWDGLDFEGPGAGKQP